MEAIIKKRAVSPDSGRAAMAVHAASRAISKPKIRIIHIFSPEIINTDAANFRDLVQRLTGKPPAPAPENTAAAEKLTIHSDEDTAVAAFDRTPESGGGGGAWGRVKEEEELWNDVVEIEGFFEDLGEMLGFGETQFL